MPPLRNPRHEGFAQALARGRNAAEAYSEAGYKTRDETAAAKRGACLAGDAAITRRVAEIQDGAAISADAGAAPDMSAPVTVDTLIAEAEHVRRLALEAGRFADAIAAIKEKGVLAGIRVEKRDAGAPVDPKSLSDEELALIARGGSDNAAPPAPAKEIPD